VAAHDWCFAHGRTTAIRLLAPGTGRYVYTTNVLRPLEHDVVRSAAAYMEGGPAAPQGRARSRRATPRGREERMLMRGP